ncbi:MAG: multicopper oxidase domain-containing protein [Bacteroidota bacterium]
MWIPDTLTGSTFNLTVKDTFRQFFPGQQTITEAVNGNWWGPTLIFNKGQNVQLNVINNLTDTTTMHWHGVHLPAIADGGPHQPVPPGTTWSPSYTVLNNASTYWYHPHLHMMVEEQVNMGIGGFIIIRDTAEAALNLPRTYGVDDIPLVLTDRRFDASNQIVMAHFGDTMVVNGTINPQYTVPAQIVRMRILNAAPERFYRFGFSNNATFRVIGTDGGLMNAPSSQTRFTLAPGERVEILVNFAGLTGTSVDLVAYNNSLPGDVAGGSPGTGVFANALGARQFNMLHLNIGTMTANPVTTFPVTLLNITYPTAASATVTRHVTMSDGGAACPAGFSGCGMLDSAFFNINVINHTIILNTTEIWEIQNVSAFAHPFHMHNVQFYILDRNGVAAPAYEKGWKDVMQVRPGTTARFVTRFTDYADSIRPYMYHCHNLFHEDGGMMGQFVVIDTMRPPDAILLASDSVICAGECISFTGTAATNVDHYQWSFPGGSPVSDTVQQVTVCYSTPGIYNVTLIESNQSGADTLIKQNFITVQALPVVTLSATDSVCLNSGNVTLTGNPAGGIYSGLHVSGNSFSPVAAGSFSVVYQYTNGNGCTNSDTAIIVVNNLPSVTLTVQDTVCVNSSNISLNGNPSGGIYSGPGVTGSFFNPASAGTGTFILYYNYTDAHGCNSSDSEVVFVADTTPVHINTSGSFCDNAGIIALSATPSGGVFSGTGVSGNNFNPLTSGAGNHIITYVYTNSNGCVSGDTSLIAIHARPVVSLTGPDSICLNAAAAILTGTPSGGIYNGAVTDSVFNPAALGAGNHTAFYFYTDNFGCSNSDLLQVTVIDVPAITFTVPSTVCSNENQVTLVASPAGGVFSGTAVSGNVFDVTAVTPGNYYIYYRINGLFGCTSEDSVLISVLAAPQVQLDAVNPLCIYEAPITLNGTPAGGIYSGAGVTGNIFDPSGAGAGSHVITYIYITAQLCIDSASITIVVHSSPVVDLTGPSALCIDENAVILSGTPTGGSYSGAVNDSLFDPAVTGAGNHLVYYSYTDLSGCSASDSLQITVNDISPISFSVPDTICLNNGLLSLTATPVGGVFSGAGVSGNSFSPSLTGAGSFYIYYNYPGASGCASSDSILITVLSVPVVTLDSISPKCLNGTTASLNGLPAGGIYTGSGVTGSSFDPAVAGIGTHTITYIYTTPQGCSDSASIPVVVNNIPNVSITGPSSACASDGPVTFHGSPAGGEITGTGITNNGFEPAVSGPGTFTLHYMYGDANGCYNYDSIVITVYPTPVVVLTAPDTVCQGNDVTLLGSPSGGTYNGTGVTDSTFHSAVAGPGTFVMTYNYSDTNNCPSFDQTTVFVENNPVVTVTIPDTVCLNNGIVNLSGTPNGIQFSGAGVSGNQFDPLVPGAGNTYIIYSYTGVNCTTIDSSLLFVDACIGIAEEETEWIHIYPNPATQNILVTTNSRVDEITLFDSFGREIYNSKGSVKTFIPLGNAEAGVLLLRVKKDGKYFYRKIIKL